MHEFIKVSLKYHDLVGIRYRRVKKNTLNIKIIPINCI